MSSLKAVCGSNRGTLRKARSVRKLKLETGRKEGNKKRASVGGSKEGQGPKPRQPVQSLGNWHVGMPRHVNLHERMECNLTFSKGALRRGQSATIPSEKKKENAMANGSKSTKWRKGKNTF